MFWTFVEARQVSGERVTIEGDAGHHLARVLRVRPGERGVAVHAGRQYTVEVIDARGDRVAAAIIGEQPVGGEPAVEVTVLQALLPNPDFDAVLEAGTAVGVRRFIAVSAERSVSRPASNRKVRWHSIARSAAEQSHRGTIPEVTGPTSLTEALSEVRDTRLLVLDPDGRTPIANAGAGTTRVSVAIGPEGGWSDNELRMMSAGGGIPTSLGPRILRARLAPVIATAILVQQS